MADAQKSKDGFGPLYHRRYMVKLQGPESVCREVMAKFKADINTFSPQLIAKFKKTAGDPSILANGDEYDVLLTLPFDAPVRVQAVHEQSFKLETLDHHIEAGVISFSMDLTPGSKIFKIESIARSRDRFIDLLYDKIPFARKAQEMMWTSMCSSFAQACSGGRESEISVLTEKFNEATEEWDKV